MLIAWYNGRPRIFAADQVGTLMITLYLTSRQTRQMRGNPIFVVRQSKLASDDNLTDRTLPIQIKRLDFLLIAPI